MKNISQAFTMNEKEIEKIKNTIKVYKSRLAGEKKRFGGYFDSGGVRYKIPELYIQLGDYKGALRYFNWFEKEFPDDSCFPFFDLLWSFAYFKNKREKDAIRLAYKTAFSDIYLISLLCNKPISVNDKSESQDLVYANGLVEWCEKLLTRDFKEWICRLYETEEFKANMNKFISIQKLIDDKSLSESRSGLIDESDKLERKLTRREDE
jgi:tetratricopeptide (TPR) repeat protein